MLLLALTKLSGVYLPINFQVYVKRVKYEIDASKYPAYLLTVAMKFTVCDY